MDVIILNSEISQPDDPYIPLTFLKIKFKTRDKYIALSIHGKTKKPNKTINSKCQLHHGKIMCLT